VGSQLCRAPGDTYALAHDDDLCCRAYRAAVVVHAGLLLLSLTPGT